MLKTWHYIAIALLVVVLAAMGLFHKQIFGLFKKKPAANPDPNPVVPSGDTGLNLDKVLQNGVYNSDEVSQLQRWLGGVDVDGDFGPQTEKRLMEVKGVKKTTLREYPSIQFVTTPAVEGGEPEATEEVFPSWVFFPGMWF